MELKPWHRHYDYNVPTTVRVPRPAIDEPIQIPANAYPDKAALNFYGTEITFWEQRALVRRFANALGSLGVQKGERMGIHLSNCPQYPIAYDKVPKPVAFRTSLPKSANRKVLRKILRAEEEAEKKE